MDTRMMVSRGGGTLLYKREKKVMHKAMFFDNKSNECHFSVEFG